MLPRSLSAGVFVLFGLALPAAPLPTYADHAPVYVVPSRPGVPVVINGRDASYAVVEGDWGLSRPGFVPPTVIGGSPLAPNPVYTPRRSYHPRSGQAPPLGRHEVEPPADRALPPPAESYFRSWSSFPEPQGTIEASPPSVGPLFERERSYNFPGIDIAPPRTDDPEPMRPPKSVGPRNRRP
jgi:hypothetical protein